MYCRVPWDSQEEIEIRRERIREQHLDLLFHSYFARIRACSLCSALARSVLKDSINCCKSIDSKNTETSVQFLHDGCIPSCKRKKKKILFHTFAPSAAGTIGAK